MFNGRFFMIKEWPKVPKTNPLIKISSHSQTKYIFKKKKVKIKKKKKKKYFSR